VYSERRNIKKYLPLIASLFALSLILGYTGNAKAATSAGELEQSLVHVSEEVKLSVVSITTVKVFKHPVGTKFRTEDAGAQFTVRGRKALYTG
jgi:hypothetical protein